MKFDFYIPTKVVFGAGRLEELATMKLPGSKALIAVTADGIMKKLGYQDKVTSLFEKNGVSYVIYDKVQPNPTRKGVMEAAKFAREEGCDFVVGLGGGSSIDTAKATAIMLKNDGDLWDYASAGTGKRQVPTGAVPIVTITTTAGTGTEADPWCVITNEDTGEKLDFYGEYLYPTLSVIDPAMMVTVPASLTAFQGMDAFFHAAEGYIATCATPISDMASLKAIELVTKHLPVAVNNGKDIEARTQVSYAANVLCGIVQSTSSCTSPHIIGQTLGGLYPGLPHGASLTVIAAHYYEAVADKVPYRFADIARAMGVDVDSLAPDERPRAFVAALNKLMKDCGVDGVRMSDYGVERSELRRAAKIAMDVGFDLDRYQLTLDDVVEILEKSYI